MIKYKEIKLGEASAEQESAYTPELLLEGFLDPWNISKEVINGPKCVFLGYKGSGKSAVGEHLRLIANHQPMLFVNLNFLRDFPYANFAKIVTGEAEPEARLPSAWTWILILFLLESFARDAGAESDSDNDFLSAIKSLKDSGLLPSGDLNRFVVASSKAKYKVKFPPILDIEWDANKKKVNDIEFLHIIDRLKSIAMEFRSKSKHFLILDGLDDILLQKDIQYQSLAALILEVTRLNFDFARNGIPAKIIVLCRTELYERLPGPNKNKVRQDLSIELDWYHNPQTPESSNLVHLINNRAMMSDKDIKSLFVQYFPRECTNQPILFFLLQQTRHTPRDFIQLLKKIQSCTRGVRVEEKEIFAGIRNYSSKYFLPEIKDELVGYMSIKEIDEIFRALSAVNRSQFSLNDLSSQLTGSTLLTEHTLTELVDMLFQCSAIGNVTEDKAGRRHYSFKYRNRHAFCNTQEGLAVHKGLWQALRLLTRSG